MPLDGYPIYPIIAGLSQPILILAPANVQLFPAYQQSILINFVVTKITLASPLHARIITQCSACNMPNWVQAHHFHVLHIVYRCCTCTTA